MCEQTYNYDLLSLATAVYMYIYNISDWREIFSNVAAGREEQWRSSRRAGVI